MEKFQPESAPMKPTEGTYSVERDGDRVIVHVTNDESFVFIRDGKGGVTLTSRPIRRTRSNSEMSAIFKAAHHELYEAA
jgi:hypothetical protein